MTEIIMMKIIDFREKAEVLKEFEHLVQYQAKPADLPKQFENFREKESYPAGNLLVGDLVINEEFSKQLEMHPFPEWVAQFIRLDTAADSVNGYCVALNLSAKEIKKIERKDWRERKDAVKELVKELKPEGLVAFRMAPGICVKVPGSVPHYFISAKKADGKEYPYCQVYEPKITFLDAFRHEPTAYFQTPFEIRP
jgi:hypothetical protein